MKTYSAKPGEVERRWFVVDADGKVLGRLASEIARILRGKHKPEYTPHVDVGDFVIVVNAERIALTGKKLSTKWYRHHSGYPGGLKSVWYERLLETHPERAIEKAVWGMLPKTRLGRKMVKKLKVYRGPSHPHEAQKPEPLDIGAMAGPDASQIRGMAKPQETVRQARARRKEEAAARAPEPKAEESQPEPKAEQPEPKAEEPKAEQPEPKAEEPKAEEPKAEQPEPEAEEPKAEQPEAEEPEPEAEESQPEPEPEAEAAEPAEGDEADEQDEPDEKEEA